MILFSIFLISITFTFKIKYLFNTNIVKINVRKYIKLPCQVFIRSNLRIIKSFFSFFKFSLSVVANLSNVFFFNAKHSSSLINIDLRKGYFGLIPLLLFSIELIVCSGIFEISYNCLMVRFCWILASFTNFAISIFWSNSFWSNTSLFSVFLKKNRIFKIFMICFQSHWIWELLPNSLKSPIGILVKLILVKLNFSEINSLFNFNQLKK